MILLVGAGLRMWLFRSHSLAHWLSERPELVTPLTSWKRVTEGLALRRAGVAPYDGDVYHETPLMLRMVDFADEMLGQNNMWILLLIVDLMTALVLNRVAVEMRQHLLQHQTAEEKRFNLPFNFFIKHCLDICLDTYILRVLLQAINYKCKLCKKNQLNSSDFRYPFKKNMFRFPCSF